MKEGIIAYKIAAHAADIARIRSGIHDSRGRAFLGCYRIDLEEAVRALART
jgi:thiamine biosynthesis protein ThiC